MTKEVPWRDYDPQKPFRGDGILQHLADMRFVHSAKRHQLEPPDITERLKPYRKMREEEPTRFLTEMLKMEREAAEKAEAEIAKIESVEGKKTDATKPNTDTAHCVALVEKLIAEWHVKHPGALEMKP